MNKNNVSLKQLKEEQEAIRKELSKMNKAHQASAHDLAVRRDELYDLINEQVNVKLLNKCFVTRNCYVSGDEWPLYYRVIDAEGDGLTVLSIQRDSEGIIIINTSVLTRDYLLSKNKISPSEFKKRTKAIMSRVNSCYADTFVP